MDQQRSALIQQMAECEVAIKRLEAMKRTSNDEEQLSEEKLMLHHLTNF